MPHPRYQFIGGRLDGHVGLREGITISTWPDGMVRVRVDGVRDGYWLLYAGVLSLTGGPTRLVFQDYMPITLHPGFPGTRPAGGVQNSGGTT